MFGGWYTLTYAFSQKQSDGTVTDYYLCSRDVSELLPKERPPFNEAVFREFGKEVYGFCIVAPATAFDGEK